MQAFIKETGYAAWIPSANVNTDTIIRMDRLMMVSRKALGDYALEVLRFHPDGSERADFILNQPPFRDAPFLIGGENFGCGSSREAAVWALTGRGIRCIIALSFGDIFRENCFKNGLLPIQLDADAHGRLLQDWHAAVAPARQLEVDLAAQTLRTPGGQSIPFEVSAFARSQLLSGEDEVSTTLKQRPRIEQHLTQYHQAMPWAQLSIVVKGSEPPG